MSLQPSAHVDSFARDNLPPAEHWPHLEFTLPELQQPPVLNAAAELLEAGAPDALALRTPAGEVWTYAELRLRAEQVAQVLTEDLGLVPGNRVLLRAPNTPWVVAAWLGTLLAGGVAVVTMSALRARELGPVVDKTRTELALVDHRCVDDAEAVGLRVVAFGGEGDDDLVARCATKSGGFTPVATSSDDVALLGPTSGSTGVPKITMHFHRDVLAIDTTFGRPLLGLRPDDVVACTAPLAFTFGLGMLVVFPLRAGACALLTESATPVQLAELVAEHGVTVLATAPTAYRQIIKAGCLPQLAGLRRAVSAGEHIPQVVWERVRDELGLRIIDGIGSTELLHIFISAADDDIRPGATGRPVPGYRATVLGPDDQPVPVGTEGRLAVIGPVCCRYLDDERQSAYVADGWNVTGDTFVEDADGYFHYRSRTDSMIVSSGYNIGAPEVEAALETHPDVLEAGVVAEPDPERGHVVSAFVVLRDGLDGDLDETAALQAHVRAELAPYKYPRRVRYVDALPRNTSGKLQHFKLRELIGDSQDRTGQPEEEVAR